jgi:hypothetical protein
MSEPRADRADRSADASTRVDVLVTLAHLSGRVELLAYKVEQLERSTPGLAPKSELEGLAADVRALKSEVDDVLPHVREMIRDDTTKRDRSEETLRAIIKWGAVGLLAFAVLSVLYALGLFPSPLPN